MKISDSAKCDFCFLYDQTIEHLFFDCFVIMNFWLQVSNLLKKKKLLTNILSRRDIILEYQLDKKMPDLTINQVILYCKRFIFICKSDTNRLTLQNFINFTISHLSPLCTADTSSGLLEHENNLIDALTS